MKLVTPPRVSPQQFDAAMQLYCRYEGIEKPQKPEAAA